MNENIYPLSTLHLLFYAFLIFSSSQPTNKSMHSLYFAFFFDEEDGDEKGGGGRGKEEDTEKEEPPVAIPMIGDTKTGPLSLIAGQDNHRREPVKKTRVGRESSRHLLLSFHFTFTHEYLI